jgi:hypothetical protein
MASDGRWDPSRGFYNSLDTIDTFSFTIALSISNHSLYSYGRRFARYAWQKPKKEAEGGGLARGVIKRIKQAKKAKSTEEVENTNRNHLPIRPGRSHQESTGNSNSRNHSRQG